MKRFLLGLFIVAALLPMVGCSLLATMIPVEGPLSLLRPVPIFKIKADGIGSGGGKLTTALTDDSCTGRWATLTSGPNVGFSSGSLISQYGSVYLSGYSVSTSSHPSGGQGIMTCIKGKVIQAEFVSSGAANHGFGIAKDNESNVYRIIF